MKRKIYKLLSGAKQGLFALALTVFSGTAYSQTTYTFNYTGSQQTMLLQAGTYTIETWGADGGDNLGNGSTTFLQNGGKGGYSKGTYSLASAATIYINVGGRGGNSTSTLNVTVPGGYNGGGYGSSNSISGKSSGAGGGGATHVATATGVLSALSGNQSAVLIVGGGGGGAGESNYASNNTTYNSNGGYGGGTSGIWNTSTGYQGRNGQGGTQLAGGGGGDNGSAIAGVPLQGIFGAGGYNTAVGANTSAGGSGAGGGGGGWYGGGSGWVSTGSSYEAGSGGGGSGYIGGVTTAITTASGQTGYVANPVTTGDGRVLITELCSVRIYASGSNSLNPAICSGNSLTLTTTAVSNYTWSTGNTTNTMIVVSPTSSQTYSVIGTGTAPCQSSGFISVTVNSVLPVLSITNTPSSICLGKTATLTASGALSYTWSGGPGGIINGQTFTPTATSNYTVAGQNGCGTTTSVTTITIAPLAVSASASPSLSCSGNPVTMTVTSAATGYTWSPGPVTGSNVIVAPNVNTVYTVTASDGTCSGVTTVTVNTKPNPTITIAASNQTVCEGAVVTMTASGAATYTWTSPNSNSPNISDNPTTATLYQVSGTNSVNCVSSANQLVFTNPTPILVLTSNKTIVCTGDPVTLTASGATTYNWTNGPATASYTVNPTSGNNTYTASGTTAPCTGTAAITINVLTASVAVSVATPSICIGETASLHASGATTYTWVGASAFSPGNANVTPSVTTIYTVNATTIAQGLSCPSSANITITVFNNPVVTIVASNSVVCKSDPNIVLTGTGATTYTWSTATVSTNISVHPQSTTTYSVTGVDANGCVNTASKIITVNACTGIAELTNKEKNISVYPNPNNGTFMLKSNAAMDLILVNELGQSLQSFKLQESADFSVEIKDLKPGIYFILNEKGSGAVAQKIVVN